MLKDYKTLALKNNFIFLWTSQALSQMTVNIVNFLLLIKIYSETGSILVNSFLWIVYALPALFFGPIAAASVDLTDRRKILMLTNFLQFIVVGIYALIFQTGYMVAFIVVFIYSTLNQFYVPAEAASLTVLVNKKRYPEANGLFFLTQQAAIVAGFGLAGILNQLVGFEISLIICSLLLLCAFIAVSFLPSMRLTKQTTKTLGGGIRDFYSQIIKGFSYTLSHKNVLTPFAMMITLWVGATVMVINVPVFATDIMRIEANHAGILLIAPTAIGSAVFALLIPKILRLKIRKGRVILTSLFGMVVGITTISLLVPLLPEPLKLIVGVPALMLSGAFFVGVFIPTLASLQELTPKKMYGRIFGNMWFIITLATLLPTLFSGIISELYGIQSTLIVLNIAVLLTFFAVWRYFSKRGADKFVRVSEIRLLNGK